MTYVTDLLDSLRARIRELDLERQRLVDAEQALVGGPGVDAELARYGLKPDGTPRKRPPMSAEHKAKISAAAAAKREAKQASAKAEEIRLNTLSSTHPTPSELDGRSVRWTTEGPG